MRELSYDDALAALKAALKFGINPSLDGIAALCEELGRPQDALSVIQVTGTNGKSSTCRFIEALLRAEGCRTGLYTSPELERYPERIEIAGEVVSDADFAQAVAAALDAADALRPGLHGSGAGFTEFELLTAGALWLMREMGVEAAVLEVGLGGRWDATSVAVPRVAVVTGVGLDHMAILGDTLEAIAAEKAAIIRPGSVAVLGPGVAPVADVFLARADEVGAPVLAPRYEVTAGPASPLGETVVDIQAPRALYPSVPLRTPAYQAGNLATAVVAAESWLGRALSRDAVTEAASGIRLPGRFEVLRTAPIAIVDGSHNPQAALVLAESIAAAWPDADDRPVVVLGVLADKDAAGIASALAPVAERFVVTAPDSPRALLAEELAAIVTSTTLRPADVATDLAAAIRLAEDTGRPFVVTGSLTTAGQARGLLCDKSATGTESDGG